MKTPAEKIKDTSWFSRDLYPFRSHYLELDAGNMHYIDEGSGDPLVFVHGTPSWSFLYRNQITALREHYRCIAPDHIGFGLSEKPDHFEGDPKQHAEHFRLLMEHLDLANITLVVHDFGGPIALPYALDHPENVDRLVLFNTWLWETANNPDVQKIDRIVNSWIGKLLYLRFNFSPRVLLRQSFYDKSQLTSRVHAHYRDVFPDKNSRYALLRIARALKGSSDWYQQQWERLHAIADKPVLMLWGVKDEFIKPEYLERWKMRFSNCQVHSLECGHFVQEEKTAEVNRALAEFLPAGS
ncbi:MAG: alpha/beta fold hydrolase [Balneolaceae bacterium]|nr:alpha/beta fold hydrolase [Balneolaceae bacterium]